MTDLSESFRTIEESANRQRNSANEKRQIRWKNYVLNAKEREEGKIDLESMPTSIMLPTGRRCNLRCIMCIDRSDPSVFRDFSLQDFLSLAPAIDYASSVAIYGWGEPLMNPEYEAILDYVRAHYPGIILHISTNGTLLDDHWRKTIISISNCFLNISVNAATRKTYLELMGYDRFDDVIENLRWLMDLKRRTGSQFPIVTLSFVMMRQNIHELPQFVSLAQRLGVDDILISDLMRLEPWHDELSVETVERKMVLQSYEKAKLAIKQNGYGPTLTQFSDIPYLPPEHGNICIDPWDSLKIGDDGSVSICCYANRTFGNIFQQTVDEIWNSEDVKYYRKTVNTKDPPDPCRLCPKKRESFQKRYSG